MPWDNSVNKKVIIYAVATTILVKPMQSTSYAGAEISIIMYLSILQSQFVSKKITINPLDLISMLNGNANIVLNHQFC